MHKFILLIGFLLFAHTSIQAAEAIQYRYRAELLSMPNPSPAIDLDRTIRCAVEGRA